MRKQTRHPSTKALAGGGGATVETVKAERCRDAERDEGHVDLRPLFVAVAAAATRTPRADDSIGCDLVFFVSLEFRKGLDINSVGQGR